MREGHVLVEHLVELFLKTYVLRLQGMSERIVIDVDVQVSNKNDLVSLSMPLTKEVQSVKIKHLMWTSSLSFCTKIAKMLFPNSLATIDVVATPSKRARFAGLVDTNKSNSL